MSLSGNMSAFATIVKRYEKLVASITIPMLGNKFDADDIGQDTFIRFYKSMDKYKGDSKLGTYIVKIAINLSLNEIKKRSRHRIVSTESNYVYPEMDNETAKDDTELINIALGKIEPEFRSVIVLRHIQGFSTKETADILGFPQGTVLSRLSRGMEKLKQIIIKIDTA